MAWTQRSLFIIKDSYLRKTCPDNNFHFVSTACSDYTLIIDKMTLLVGVVKKIIFIFVDLVVLFFLLFFKEQMNQFGRAVLVASIQWYLLLKMPAEFLAPV